MSLRNRLVLGMVVVAVVLVLTAVATTKSTEANLIRQVDAQLRSVSLRAAYPRRPALDRRLQNQELSEVFLATIDQRGELVVRRNPNLRAAELAPPDIPKSDLAGPPVAEPRIITVNSVGSTLRYRLLIRSFPNRGRLVVGLPLMDVDEAVQRLVRVEALATGSILGLLALVTFWVLRLGVRPVKVMTSTATAIADGDFSRRVPDGSPGTEAAELGAALNTMLARIEAAFAQRDQTESRLRRFAADASHELRTPVTTIRGYAELYRRGGLSSPGALTEAMRRTEEEAVRMGELVDDLLTLARLDQGHEVSFAPVDLCQVAFDCVTDARVVRPERSIVLETVGSAMVMGERDQLHQVLANLLTNATIHTPETAPIQVRVRTTTDRTTADRTTRDSALVEVMDTGPGMSPESAGLAFERFYRADPSRSRSGGGSGLGLAIVRAVVEAHGGRVWLQSTVEAGTVVSVELPLAVPGVL